MQVMKKKKRREKEFTPQKLHKKRKLKDGTGT